MKKLNFFLVSFFFLILTAVLNAEPEIVVLKDTLSILKEQYKHLSPIYGCVWYKSPVIESMYRFGDPKDASIQLIKKLFYLNQDNVNFSEMQSSTEIATYFTPQDIGGVVGIVEKYFGEEKKDIDKKAFEGELDQYFAKPIAKAKEKLETIINSEEAALKELKPLKQKIDSQKKDFQAKEKALKQAQKDINFFSKRNEHLKEWEKEFEKYVEELKKIDEKDKKLVKQVNQLKGKKKQVEQRIKDLKELSVEKIEELKTEEPLLLQECETLSGSIKADEEQFKRLESKQTELYLLKEKAKDLGSAIKTLLFSAAQSSDDNIYLKHTVQNMLLGLMWAKSQFKKDLADYLTGLKSVLSDAIFEKSFDEKAWEENVYTKEEYKDLEELAKSDLKTLFSDKEKVFFLYFGYDVFKSKIPPKLSFRNDVSYTFEREGQELIVSQIPDCGETTLRNFFNLLLYDAETKTFQVNRLLEALDLKREDVDHESPFFIPLQFYDHYNAFYKTASHASQQSVEAHNHWMTVVANWPGVVYNRGAHLTGGQPLCEISSQYYKGHGRYGLENMNNLVTTLTGKNLKELFQAFFVKVFKKEEIEIGSFWQEEESADNETIINFIVADSVFSLIFYPGHFEINFPKKVFPIEKDSLLKTISLSEALTKNDDFTLTMLSLYVPFDPTIEVSDNGFEQCPLLYQLFRNKDLKVSEATYYHLLFSHELRNYQVILSIFGSILLRKDINSERKQGLINRFYKSLSGNDNHTQAIAVGYFIEYDKDFFKNIRKYELSFLGNIKALTEIFTNDRFLASAKRIEDIKNSGIWQCLQDFVDNKEIKELADSPYNDQICNLITRVLNVYKQDLHQAEEFKNLLSSFVQKILRSVPLSTSLLDKIRYYLKEKVDFGLPMIRIIIDRIKENPYPLDKGPLIAECIKIIDAVFSPRAGLKESQISQKNSFLYELVEQLSQEKNEHGDFDDAILAYDQIITDDESLNFEQKNSEIKKMYHLLSSKFEAQKKAVKIFIKHDTKFLKNYRNYKLPFAGIIALVKVIIEEKKYEDDNPESKDVHAFLKDLIQNEEFGEYVLAQDSSSIKDVIVNLMYQASAIEENDQGLFVQLISRIIDITPTDAFCFSQFLREIANIKITFTAQLIKTIVIKASKVKSDSLYSNDMNNNLLKMLFQVDEKIFSEEINNLSLERRFNSLTFVLNDKALEVYDKKLETFLTSIIEDKEFKEIGFRIKIDKGKNFLKSVMGKYDLESTSQRIRELIIKIAIKIIENMSIELDKQNIYTVRFTLHALGPKHIAVLALREPLVVKIRGMMLKIDERIVAFSKTCEEKEQEKINQKFEDTYKNFPWQLTLLIKEIDRLGLVQELGESIKRVIDFSSIDTKEKKALFKKWASDVVAF